MKALTRCPTRAAPSPPSSTPSTWPTCSSCPGQTRYLPPLPLRDRARPCPPRPATTTTNLTRPGAGHPPPPPPPAGGRGPPPPPRPGSPHPTPPPGGPGPPRRQLDRHDPVDQLH